MKRRIANFFLTAFFALLPLGTRSIFRMGGIGGVAIEPGTVSIFATQLLAIATAFFCWLATGRDSRDAALRAPATIFGATFVALIVGESLLSGGVRDGTWTVAAWAVIGLKLFVTLRAYRPRWQIAATGFVAGGIFQAALASWQFLTQEAAASKWLGMAAHSAINLGASVVETVDGRWLRAYGTTSHPNVLGVYLALAIITAIAVTVHAPTRRLRLAVLAAIPIIEAGRFFTFSRASILALVIGVLVFAAASWKKFTLGEKRRLAVALFAIMATMAVMSAVFTEPFAARVGGMARLERKSFDERSASLQNGFALFVGAPLFGVGPGRAVFALNEKFAGRVSAWDLQPPHNVPLLLLVETGLTGFGLFLAFFFSAVRRRLSALPIALLAACVVASLFDHFLWSSWFGQALFFALLGLSTIAVDPLAAKE